MSSLLEEYRHRHGLKSICPINEGVLFFNLEERPILICLTSSYTKSIRACPNCALQTDCIIVELLTLDHYPACLKYQGHLHLNPDENLLDYFKSATPEFNLIPHVCSSEREQERWLWEFFLQSDPYQGSTKSKMSKIGKENENKGLTWLEQASWASQNTPEQFQVFYNAIYSICMINRKYIVFS